MNFKPLLLLAAGLLAVQAQAATVALWDFNAQSTKHTSSTNGASFALLGGVTSTFASDSGSSDPAPTAYGLNTSNYGTATTGDKTRGVQFGIDTSGYQNLVFSFDQRNSATASSYTALLYSLDQVSWTLATTFHMTTNSSFVNGLSYDFSGISGANNNPNFGVRLTTTFAPGTSSYLGSGSAYGSSGTIRYDMVMLSGSEIPAPVPEPGTTAMLLAGLGVMGMLARRRRAD